MIPYHSTNRWLARYPAFAAAGYLALVGVFCLTGLLALMDVVEGFRARDASFEILGSMAGRRPLASNHSDDAADPWPPGSPFLEGQTETLASAALLQRLSAAVSLAGGNLLSSEVEPQDPQSKSGYLKAMATLEVESSALQKLLYEIEAGMPFLFIDQLVVNASGSGDNTRLRVLVQASGRWSGTQ